MKVCVAILIASLSFFAGQDHASPPQRTDADRARIEKEVSEFLASYVAAIEARDVNAIRQLYVEDERLAWFSDGERLYSSADDVIARLSTLEGVDFSTETTEVQILPLSPDLAHARTTFHSEILQAGAVSSTRSTA